MSNAIENRVVEMRFDNKQFEEGVADSIQSLDRLNKSLKMQEAISGLEGIQNVANTLNLDNVARDVSYLTDWFSVMGTVGQQVVVRLTDAFFDLGMSMTRMINELTFGQINQGFSKYEQKVKSVQTIMNATGLEIGEVNEQMDKLNWYTDETSYSFTGMVNNIGKFTSNGIKLDQAVESMMGIGNAAGLAGASVTDATHAMDGFSKAMGQGYMTRMNWQWIRTAHMDTVKFKEELINSAVQLGKLRVAGEKNGQVVYRTMKGNEVSVSNFEEALKDAWMDVDVMNNALSRFGNATNKLYKAYTDFEGEYTTSELIEMMGDDLDEVGIKAFRAAQEAKTFTDAIEAVKDAVSTGWMNTFELIFGNYDEARVIWTELANELWDVFASGAEARNNMLREWHDMGGYRQLIQTVKNVWGTLRNIIDPLGEVFREFFPATTADRLYKITGALEDFTRHVRDLFSATREVQTWSDVIGEGLLSEFTENPEGERRLESIRFIFSGIVSVLRVLADIGESVVIAFAPLGTTFAYIADGALDFVGLIGDVVTRVNSFIHSSNILQNIGKAINGVFTQMNRVVKPIVQIFKNVVDAMRAVIDKIGEFIGKIRELESVQTAIEHIKSFAKKVSEYFSTAFEAIVSGLETLSKKKLNMPTMQDFINIVDAAAKKFNEFVAFVKSEADRLGITDWFNKTKTSVEGSITGIFNAISDAFNDENTIFGKAKKLGEDIITGFVTGINSLNVRDILSSAVTGGVVWALWEIIKLIRTLKSDLSVKDFKLSAILEKVLAPFGQLSNVMKQVANNIKAETIFKIAEAVAILAGSITVLAAIDPDKLANATAAITTMMLGMNLILNTIGGMNNKADAANKVASKLGSLVDTLKASLNFMGLGAMFISLAVSIAAMVGAIKLLEGVKLSETSVNALWAIFTGIAAIMTLAKTTFANKSNTFFLSDTTQWSSLAIFFIGIGVAVKAMAKAAASLGSVTVGQLATLGGIIIGMEAVLGATAVLMAKFQAKPGQILAFSSSMLLLGIGISSMLIPFKALASFSDTELEKLHRVVDDLGWLLVKLAGVTKILSMSSLGAGSSGKGIFAGFGKSGAMELLTLAAAIDILAAGILILGANSETAAGGIKLISDLLLSVGIYSVLKGIGNALSSLNKSTEESSGKVKDFGIAIGAAFGGIGVFLAGLALASEHMKAISDGLVTIAHTIVDNAGLFVEAILIVVGAIFTAIAGSKHKWIASATSIITAVIVAIDQMGPELFETLARTVNNALNYIVTFTGSIANTLVRAVATIIDQVARAIENNKDPLINAISRLIDAMVDLFAGVIHKFLPFVSEGVAKVVGKIGTIGAAFALIFGTISKSVGGLKGIKDKVLGGFKSLTSFISDINTRLYVSIDDTFMRLGKSTSDFAQGIYKLGTYFPYIAGGLALLTAAAYGVKAVTDSYAESMWGLDDKTKKTIKDTDELKKSQDSMIKTMEEDTKTIDLQHKGYRELVDEYRMLVDENGKIREGNEKRADQIVNELANALGLEKDQVQQLIDKNDEYGRSIENIIDLHRAQAIMDSKLDEYNQSFKDRSAAEKELAQILPERAEAQKRYNELVKEYYAEINKYGSEYNAQHESDRYYAITAELDKISDNYKQLNAAAKEAQETMYGAQSIIDDYERLAHAIELASSETKDFSELNAYLKAMENDLYGAIDSMQEKSVSSFAKLYSDYKGRLNSFSDYANELGLADSEKFISDFQTNLGYALEEYANFVAQSGDNGAAAAFAFDTEMLNTLQALNPQLAEKINSLAAGFDISNALQITGAMSSDSFIQTILGNLSTGEMDVSTAMETLTTKFNLSGPLYSEAWNASSGYFETLLTNISTGSLSVEEALSGLSAAFHIDTADQAETTSSDYISKLKQILPPKVKTEVEPEVSSVVKGALEVDATESADKTITSYADRMIDVANKTKVETSGKEVGKVGADGAASTSSEWGTSGKYVDSGFATGITENAWIVESAAISMARKALAAANKELGVASPSKEGAWSGEMYDLGLANGLTKFAFKVIRAANGVASDLLDTMRSAMTYVSDVISSDVDATPTITPVMDLSNVEAGANDLNSLLRNQNGLGLFTNGGLHTAISATLRESNGYGEEMVLAVNKLHNDISDLNSKMDEMNEKDATYEFNLATNIDGRQVAKSTSRYTRQELALLDRNTARKGGHTK